MFKNIGYKVYGEGSDIMQGDCLESYFLMIERNSIDLILTDLPYGMIDCKWDTILPFDKLWEMVSYCLKPNGTFITFSQQPFESKLICSNTSKYSYKYNWIWNKKIAGNFANAKRMPLKITENICVFGGNNYNPIKTKGKLRQKGGGKQFTSMYGYGRLEKETDPYINDEYYPTNILEFSNASRKDKIHPTQKPVELIEYLINTYSKEFDFVFDPCAGSGTTAIACENTNRNHISFEKDPEICKRAQKRLAEHISRGVGGGVQSGF